MSIPSAFTGFFYSSFRTDFGYPRYHNSSYHAIRFSCSPLADLEGGRISDFSNGDTAYAQRDALVCFLISPPLSSVSVLLPSQYTIAAYNIGPLPYPNDAIEFLNGMIDNIKTSQPDGNFGNYPGYVE